MLNFLFDIVLQEVGLYRREPFESSVIHRKIRRTDL